MQHGAVPNLTRPTPTPTFDHVVVNARDQLDQAQAAYQRLGFTLTPRGFHSLGSMNHLAIFGTDYLELIAVAGGQSARQDILEDPFGLAGLVFGSEDAVASHAALVERGVPAGPPNEFTRPVALADGARDARFRTVHIHPAEGRPGRLYFCHHFTRDLVWRDEWRQHANGATGIVRAVIASADPGILSALFARMFGAAAVHAVEGGHALTMGAGRIDILEHAHAGAQFGAAAADPAGRPHYMAGLTLRTKQLAMTGAALQAGGIGLAHSPGRIVTPAAAAMGCPIEFVP